MAGEDVAGSPERTTLPDSLGLYIHIPFCRARCGYCDFNSYAGLDHLIPAYVNALAAEIRARADALPARPPVATVYFGGGTPSLLRPGQVTSTLDACRSSFAVGANAEITLEANPGTVNLPSLKALLDAGVTRLSLGVQSFDDAELRLLGRIHDSAQAVQAFKLARRAGCHNVNLDLIYGLPGQSVPAWRQNLCRALELEPDHLSLYALTVEEDTALGRDIAAGRTAPPDPDVAADMYLLAEEGLQDAGYRHYEISNWARPGKLCRHNLGYWMNRPYLGFGAGAHSWYGARRFSNVASPEQYRDMIHRAERYDPPAWMGKAVGACESIDEEMLRAETVILGLRLVDGVNTREFAGRFGVSLDSLYARQIGEMAGAGLVEHHEGCLRLTARGRLLGNEVFQRFLPEKEAR